MIACLRTLGRGDHIVQAHDVEEGLRRELLDDGWVDLDTVIRGIENVTTEDLLRIGERVVRLDHAVLDAVGPLDDVEGLRAAIGA